MPCHRLVYYRGVISGTRAAAVGLAGGSFVAEPIASTLNLYHNGWEQPTAVSGAIYAPCIARGIIPCGGPLTRVPMPALYATNGDVFAAAALLLAYHQWSRVESNTSTPVSTVESQDFALSVQPLHDEQLAVEGEGDPSMLVAAGAGVIAAAIAHGYWIWGLYLTSHAFNTFLYVRRKQSYVQTDLQARLPITLSVSPLLSHSVSCTLYLHYYRQSRWRHIQHAVINKKRLHISCDHRVIVIVIHVDDRQRR